MKKIFAISLLMAGLIIGGCAHRKVVAPEQTGQEGMSQKQANEQAKKSPEKITEQKVANIESKEIPSKEGEVTGMFADVHFDFDKYDIREDAKSVLKSVADYLVKNTAKKVLIEGRCDERGTSEYNLGLGDRRAKAAKDYLVSLGVSSSRINTISYGKEKPLCTEHTEACWAQNRSDRFAVIQK